VFRGGGFQEALLASLAAYTLQDLRGDADQFGPRPTIRGESFGRDRSLGTDYLVVCIGYSAHYIGGLLWQPPDDIKHVNMKIISIV